MANLLNFHKPKTPLQWLIFLAAIGITLSSPAGSRAFFRELSKYVEKRFDKKERFFKSTEMSRALYYLKKRRLIKIDEKGSKIDILLTEKGRQRKLQYDLDNIYILKPKIWDGKWRLLMFDIPEPKKNAREALRNKLRQLGFLRFQKSVWVYPYPCESEIDFITEYFSIAPYITLLTIEIKNDRPLRSYFNLA